LDDDARESGNYDEIGSDIENVDELCEWMSTKPTGHQTQILPGQTLVRKYLPPGTVNDLYEHYKSTQKLLGGHMSSFLYPEYCMANCFQFFSRWLNLANRCYHVFITKKGHPCHQITPSIVQVYPTIIFVEKFLFI